MEKLASDSASLPRADQIGLRFALGKAYEDIGHFGRAGQNLLTANSLKRRELEYDEAATLSMFERIRATFTDKLVRQKRGQGNPSPDPIFIVGMPRSGTTLVEHILASHPSVFGGGERLYLHEIVAGLRIAGSSAASFPENIPIMTSAELRQVGQRYLQLLRALAPTAAYITDKLPTNFHLVGLIHLALPNARIIHVHRDPIDTCFSCFSKLFYKGQLFSYDLAELGHYYRAYTVLMDHWRSVLPDGAMLDVRYEDLIADFESQVRRLITYCKLEWDQACFSFHKTQRPVRTASAIQVRQPIYRSAVGRGRSFEHMLSPLINALGARNKWKACDNECDFSGSVASMCLS